MENCIDMFAALDAHAKISKRGKAFLSGYAVLKKLYNEATAEPTLAEPNFDRLFTSLQVINQGKELGFGEVARTIELVAAAAPGYATVWLNRLAKPLFDYEPGEANIWPRPELDEQYLLGFLVGIFRVGAELSCAHGQLTVAIAYHNRLAGLLQELLINANSRVYFIGLHESEVARMLTPQFESEFDEAIKRYLASVTSRHDFHAAYKLIDRYWRYIEEQAHELQEGHIRIPRIIDYLIDQMSKVFFISRVGTWCRAKAVSFILADIRTT